MKKCLTLLLSAALLASAVLAGCGSSSGSSSSAVSSSEATESTSGTEAGTSGTDTSAAPDGAYTTVKDGVLMVGTEVGYPPMEYFDTDGTTMIGFDIELAKAVADKLGLEVEYVDTAWDGIFAGLGTDKYDVIFSSVSMTAARQEQYCLEKPYVANRLVLITPKGSEITSMEDILGGTYTVAVQAETSSDDYAKANAIEVMGYDKVINCFDDLKAGRADAVLTDSVVASYYLGDDADQYQTVWENEEGEPIGACFKKGNEALSNAVNAAIEELYSDGTVKTLADKYFGTDADKCLLK